ncbi:MAG: OadG family protein [Clostridia bacterium]|nr:OadG family protein [Clostridia bacterium]
MNLLPASLSAIAADVLSAAADKAPAVSNGFVVAMGIGTVFVGLISIILLVKLMSLVTAAASGKQAETPAAASASAPAAPLTIENREEIVAAVCAAAAEELGTDISALRVVSFKKIS